MIPPQSHYPWIRGKRLCPCGLALWLLVFAVDKGNAQILLRHDVKCIQQNKTDLFCCNFYIHHTSQKTKEKLLFCFLFEFFQQEFESIWKLFECIEKHSINWYSVQIQNYCILMCKWEILICLCLLLFYWVLFRQGEQGDLGETGNSGETGLPGPQVTNRSSELFLC